MFITPRRSTIFDYLLQQFGGRLRYRDASHTLEKIELAKTLGSIAKHRATEAEGLRRMLETIATEERFRTTAADILERLVYNPFAATREPARDTLCAMATINDFCRKKVEEIFERAATSSDVNVSSVLAYANTKEDQRPKLGEKIIAEEAKENESAGIGSAGEGISTTIEDVSGK